MMVKCFIKQPGRAPYSTNVSNSLEALQKNVYGYIEAVSVGDDMVIVVNEEGRIKGMPFNCKYLGAEWYGPMLFLGVDGEEFADVPISFEEFKKFNKELWDQNFPVQNDEEVF